MFSLVSLELCAFEEAQTTRFAVVTGLPMLLVLVRLEGSRLGEAFAAILASIRPFSSVSPHVRGEVVLQFEAVRTFWAVERSYSFMGPNVLPQIMDTGKTFGAHFALERISNLCFGLVVIETAIFFFC